MKINDVLRKLGILRVGAASGTFKSYKDMPDELMYNNVYDKKKDLVSKNDYKNIDKVVKGNGKKPSGTGFTIMKVLFILFAAFFMLCLFIVVGLKLLFIIGLIFWIVFFVFFRKFIAGNLSMIGIIGIYVLILFLTIVLILIGAPASKNEEVSSVKNSNNQSKTNILNKNTHDCALTEYAGINASMYTFMYPKCFTIDDRERSTWVNNDKEPKYDDHIVISWFDDSKTEILPTCSYSTAEGEEAVYAKKVTLGGLEGCENSVRKMKTGSPDKFTLVLWQLKSGTRFWSIVAWARTEEDMNKFRNIATSLKFK